MATVSYNLALRYRGEYCQLEELIVDPNARGKKVGVLLVEAMLERRGAGMTAPSAAVRVADTTPVYTCD